ncbi:hypothetical protein DCAR_0309915 [Daucus carota subsp. sativus]|uniref:GTD-binding domain-containing protein n=1 Tax=Daucus carota subsp. sativus TaxID=79200 RepID=A0AAF0WLB0_DAUCS|nr:hypothetical protein DCAR_0309915 [Daucus carota subsp. sativus]
MQLRIFQRKRREVHLQQTSAADEAMSKILGLQRENAVPEMETRQCKLFAEERLVHVGHEIVVLEGMLYKRNTIQLFVRFRHINLT